MVTILSLILFFSLHFPLFPKQSFYSAIFGSEGTSSQLASPNRTVASGVSNHHPPHVNGASFGHHTAGGPCQCCQSLLPSSFNGAAPANIRYRPCLSFFPKIVTKHTKQKGGRADCRLWGRGHVSGPFPGRSAKRPPKLVCYLLRGYQTYLLATLVSSLTCLPYGVVLRYTDIADPLTYQN